VKASKASGTGFNRSSTQPRPPRPNNPPHSLPFTGKGKTAQRKKDWSWSTKDCRWEQRRHNRRSGREEVTGALEI